MKSDASFFTTGFITGVDCAGIKAGTSINTGDKVTDVIKDILAPIPNKEYLSRDIGTWSSAEDVDSFLSIYNNTTRYAGLRLGNYITINDGTYNIQWEIAGFDLEHNQTAADGTVYDNGVGMLMIPRTYVGKGMWGTTTVGGYINSTSLSGLRDIEACMRNILGNHLVNRNVLLSNGIDNSSYFSNSYQWTTAGLTFMSAGQVTGEFAQNENQYDDGEANYRLPLFNYENYLTGSNYYFLRNIAGKYGNYYRVYYMGTNYPFNNSNVNEDHCWRPLMLIR